MREIGPPLSDAEVKAWVAAARGMLGVRWRHQGRDARRGVDCAGLLIRAMASIGRPVADAGAYGREPYRNTLEGVMRRGFGEPLSPDQRRFGDAVAMNFHNGDPSHLGILGDYPYGGLSLIHAYARGAKKVIEHRLDDEWAGYIVEVYRP